MPECSMTLVLSMVLITDSFEIYLSISDILTEGLRIIFKQEWDSLYRTTLGEWRDDPSNGKDFYS